MCIFIAVLEIKLEAFEGPIDLLYKLIEKNEIDIYDIPIAKLTDQYIEHISSFPKDMESISNFLVMAIALIEIKFKMLLPKEPPIEEPYEDPREELVNKLVEYKKFKVIAESFKSKATISQKILYKSPEYEILNMLQNNKHKQFDEILENITLDELFDVFKDIIRRKEVKEKKIEVKHINKDIYTVKDKILHISNLLIINKTINFKDTFEKSSSKIEKIVTFMAILELIKLKSIKITQNNLFDEIIITAFKKEEL